MQYIKLHHQEVFRAMAYLKQYIYIIFPVTCTASLSRKLAIYVEEFASQEKIWSSSIYVGYEN